MHNNGYIDLKAETPLPRNQLAKNRVAIFPGAWVTYYSVMSLQN